MSVGLYLFVSLCHDNALKTVSVLSSLQLLPYHSPAKQEQVMRWKAAKQNCKDINKVFGNKRKGWYRGISSCLRILSTTMIAFLKPSLNIFNI